MGSAGFTTVRDGYILGRHIVDPDMEFVKKFTPSDFQAKNFTPSISPNFTF